MRRRGFLAALGAAMVVPALICRVPVVSPSVVGPKRENVLYEDDTLESIIRRRRTEAMESMARQMEDRFWGVVS